MPKGISRHEEVLKYLKTFELLNFRMPTRKEICYDIKIKVGPLQRILNGLEKKGKLKRVTMHVIQFRLTGK